MSENTGLGQERCICSFSSCPEAGGTQNGHTSGAISTVNTPVRKVSGTPMRK